MTICSNIVTASRECIYAYSSKSGMDLQCYLRYCERYGIASKITKNVMEVINVVKLTQETKPLLQRITQTAGRIGGCEASNKVARGVFIKDTLSIVTPKKFSGSTSYYEA